MKSEKNLSRNILIILIIFTVVIIYAIAAYLYSYIAFFNAISSHNVNENQLVVQFNKHKNNFQKTADYLKENQDRSYIKKTNSTKYTVQNISPINGNEKAKITDSKVTNDIKYILFSLKFEAIYEKDNDIYYIRSTGFGSMQAIVYSKDGNMPQPYRPQVIEKISGDWYYCEAEDV